MSGLRDIRKKRKISQSELAYKVGVSQRYIAFLEAGQRKPSLSLADKIAHELHSTIEEIFLTSKCTKST